MLDLATALPALRPAIVETMNAPLIGAGRLYRGGDLDALGARLILPPDLVAMLAERRALRPERPETLSSEPRRNLDQGGAAPGGNAADQSHGETVVPSAPPVLAARSKAWLVSYDEEEACDLIVTGEDAVSDCAELLPPQSIGRIRSIQRALGGMLCCVGPGASIDASDQRWVGADGSSVPSRPILGGKGPAIGGIGRPEMRAAAPAAALGAWELHWASGEMWICVCPGEMGGPRLARAIGRQFPGIEFALRRVDRGRYMLSRTPVPGRWTAAVEAVA